MAVAQFAREYRTVRHREGWGSQDGAYYRALPYRDLSGRHEKIWRIRARSYDTFLTKVLRPLEGREAEADRPDDERWLQEANFRSRTPDETSRRENFVPSGQDLRAGDELSRRKEASSESHDRGGRRGLCVLDLGAGNGWLSYRLAQRGHFVLAIDLLEDRLDGLGAVRHYAGAFSALVAEFDHLPLRGVHPDLIIFNASLHYSTNFVETLGESLRVLRAGGTLVILDSPMYSDPYSGTRMVQEREAHFLATYGFKSNALPSEHFLTPTRLSQLATELGLTWQIHRPALDWRTQVGRTIGGLRARREPAHFPVIVGTRA